MYQHEFDVMCGRLTDLFEVEMAFTKETRDGTESDVANIFMFVKETLMHYIEMQRDELIVSMIDGMYDEEYERIKAMVDREFLEQEGKTE